MAAAMVARIPLYLWVERLVNLVMVSWEHFIVISISIIFFTLFLKQICLFFSSYSLKSMVRVGPITHAV